MSQTAATKRVNTLFANDEQARAICLYDWPNAEEHYTWLATVPEQEIRSWVEAIRRDEDAEAR